MGSSSSWGWLEAEERKALPLESLACRCWIEVPTDAALMGSTSFVQHFWSLVIEEPRLQPSSEVTRLPAGHRADHRRRLLSQALETAPTALEPEQQRNARGQHH